MNVSKTVKSVLYLVGILALIFAMSACNTAPEAPGSITGKVFLDSDADTECDVCDCDFYLEGIVIRLYQDSCTGLIHQTVETDADGAFIFEDLVPGEYCVTPKVKMICEGYRPTTPIQQKVIVVSDEVVEAPWFGFNYNLDN